MTSTTGTVTASSPEPASMNPNRPALYRITGGRELKGILVRILSTDGQISAKAIAWVEEDGAASGRQASIRISHLTRHFRTAEEQALGREFTPAELAAYRAAGDRWLANYQAEAARRAITEGLGKALAGLERAAEELRRELANEHADPAEQVARAQHTLAWLLPNLGVHSLIHDAIRWATANADLRHLGPSPEAPAAEADPTV